MAAHADPDRGGTRLSAMADLRRSPLYGRHVDLGAKMAGFG
ncbi:hypothetical protein, partial [Frankia sp. CpI1-P]